jgi:hypothetical protein
MCPKVTHEPTAMTSMQDPTCRLSQGVGGVNDTWDVMHQDIIIFLPILYSERLDINVTGVFSGATCIDDLNRRNVINVNGSWKGLGKTKFTKNSTKVLGRLSGRLSGRHSSDELSLSRASGCDRLRLGAVRNCTTIKGESVTSSRATVTEVILRGPHQHGQ